MNEQQAAPESGNAPVANVANNAQRASATVAFVLAFPTLLALGGRLHWIPELATHFPLHNAIGLACFLPVFIWRRRFLAAVIVLLPLCWNLALVGKSSLPSGRAADADATHVTVLSANVLGRNRQFDRLRNMIRHHDPDILVLMELSHDGVDALEPLFDDYPHRIFSTERGVAGIGLLSKRPVEGLKILPLGALPSVTGTVDLGEETVRIVGTHPLPPVSGGHSSQRNHQLRQVAKFISEHPEQTIMVGDLNLTPWSPCFSELMRRAELHDSRQGYGNLASWPASLGPLGIPIDHILVSRKLVVKNRLVTENFGSDHRGVVAEISVAP